MAKFWTFVSLLVIHYLHLTVTEDIGCFVHGECTQSPYVEDWSVADVQECLESCQKFDGCEFFTYLGLEDYCLGFTACVELNLDCQECYSGNTSCPDLQCWIRGSCYGIFISEEHVGTDGECLNNCKDDLSCDWFTYNDADGSCILFESCDDFSSDNCDTCWSGQRQCGERKDLTKIMVVAGWNDEVLSFDSVQAIDLTTEVQTCLSPSDYAFAGLFLSGTLFNGVPMVCGGYNDDENLITDECFQYDYQNNIWTPTIINMLESRAGHMGSMVDSATWLISGGENEAGDVLDSTEVWQGGPFSYGPKLPSARVTHCQVTLNSSHVAILGGINDTSSLYDFYWLDWDSQDWIPMPDVPVHLQYDPCGLIDKSINGQELVVLADYENCHIFNFGDNIWRTSSTLDESIFSWSMVAQKKKNFYILGGELEGGASTDVFEYDAENYQWVRQSFALSKPTEVGVAIPVPDHVVNCP